MLFSSFLDTNAKHGIFRRSLLQVQGRFSLKFHATFFPLLIHLDMFPQLVFFLLHNKNLISVHLVRINSEFVGVWRDIPIF